MNQSTPIIDHQVFEELFAALKLVARNIPNCSCHPSYKDRELVDPTCHRHAWLNDSEIQTIYFVYDYARLLKKEADE